MGGVRMVKISSMARFLSAALGFWLALAVGAHAQLVQDGNFNTTGTWNYSHGANYTTGSSCDGSSGGCATIGHSGSDYISQSSSSSLAIGTYTLTLDLNAVSGSTTFSIAVTGGAGSTVTLSTISPSGTATVGWSAYTVTVTVANAALTNPVLTITNTGNTNSLLLDNVSLVVKNSWPHPRRRRFVLPHVWSGGVRIARTKAHWQRALASWREGPKDQRQAWRCFGFSGRRATAGFRLSLESSLQSATSGPRHRWP